MIDMNSQWNRIEIKHLHSTKFCNVTDWKPVRSLKSLDFFENRFCAVLVYFKKIPKTGLHTPNEVSDSGRNFRKSKTRCFDISPDYISCLRNGTKN
jgi:hypothetical protein